MTIKFSLLFMILSLASEVRCREENVDINKKLRINLDAASISASVDFPECYNEVNSVTLSLFSGHEGGHPKLIRLIENNITVVESVTNVKNGMLVVDFKELGQDQYQIDDDGKIILDLSRNRTFFRIRVDANEFLRELLKKHRKPVGVQK